MDRKKIAIVFFIIGVVFVLLNFFVIYPFINCIFAPLVFWLVAAVGIVGGFLKYYDIKLFHSYDE
ncbi:MAG: hypothetical protein ACFE85_11300 [Candidatus Hodarchaeota archaeon]